jgi:hypothetical protein
LSSKENPGFQRNLWVNYGGKTEAKVEHPAPGLLFEEYEHFKPAQNFTFALRTA